MLVNLHPAHLVTFVNLAFSTLFLFAGVVTSDRAKANFPSIFLSALTWGAEKDWQIIF